MCLGSLEFCAYIENIYFISELFISEIFVRHVCHDFYDAVSNVYSHWSSL